MNGLLTICLRGSTQLLTGCIDWRAGLMLLAVWVIGCESSTIQAPTASGQGSDTAVRSEVTRGPVQLTVEVAPQELQLSDEPKLTLTIRAEQGVRVVKPPFGAALGDFQIRDFYEPEPETDGASEVLRQVYTLEPTRAGTLSIAPIAVRFFDERSAGDGKEYTVESEALTVEVSTMLADTAPSLADLRPPTGPVALPGRSVGRWWWAITILLLCSLAGAIVWKLCRKRETSEPHLSPQEMAWLELAQIIERKLAEVDVKEFYVELTGVVRRYIERSTGVHAPEQTTEEFLREIVDGAVFRADDQQRLRDFLESADLVKFAAFQPNAADIEASFERAQEFIRLQRSAPPEVAA